MQGMSTCGNAINLKDVTVKACLNSSFCANGSGTFLNTLSDDGVARMLLEIVFNDLTENKHYSLSSEEIPMLISQVKISKPFCI